MKTRHKNNQTKTVILLILLMICQSMTAQPRRDRRPSGNRSWRNTLNETRPDFFKTEEARRIGQQLILWQRCTGGWPKNIDMVTPMTDEQKQKVAADKQLTDDSTIDNGATTQQMRFLARLFQQTGDKQTREAFIRGVEFLLSGQYEDGGWPQFWPNPHGYQVHITFNDDAIYNTMVMLRDMVQMKEPYQGKLTDKKLRQRMQKAFDKGVECILATQIRVDGQPTIWCQQHDHETLKPAKARAYELPSYGPQESASLVQLLMQLPNPDERVKQAVHGAMRWFDKYKLTGLRLVRTGWREGTPDVKLVKDEHGGPLWARYYDLEHCEPYVCDRDGVPRRRLEDIGHERRNGYSWYGSHPAELYPLYDEWADRYDPAHKVNISLSTKGANENGTLQMFNYRKPQRSLFDAVVGPGESIQAAIEQAPNPAEKPFKILILKGEYHEKVIIDRPNIVLVGEQRDSTLLVLAETAKTQTIKEYHGKPVGNGVIVLQEGADDCVISGLTVYNNYGTTVENTTTHQMAIFGRATRTIVINCNVWADGNDALSLWAQGGNGMYYHADLNLRCPGVDFLCPRGWCYATRCRFYGDGRAIIWHDGRGDKQKKLVITNSTFDAKRPTPLGRYHHDAQFFLVNCQLSQQIMDANISYAYTDKVLDPCPWGQRTYYYNCSREGGHSGWLNNNLQEADNAPDFFGITAEWTFGGEWNPEKHIRELWPVLAY
jgi:PelA/Pel-15E family pectate lyase